MSFKSGLIKYNEHYDNIKDPWQLILILMFVSLFAISLTMENGLVVSLSVFFVLIITIIRMWWCKENKIFV